MRLLKLHALLFKSRKGEGEFSPTDLFRLKLENGDVSGAVSMGFDPSGVKELERVMSEALGKYFLRSHPIQWPDKLEYLRTRDIDTSSLSLTAFQLAIKAKDLHVARDIMIKFNLGQAATDAVWEIYHNQKSPYNRLNLADLFGLTGDEIKSDAERVYNERVKRGRYREALSIAENHGLDETHIRTAATSAWKIAMKQRDVSDAYQLAAKLGSDEVKQTAMLDYQLCMKDDRYISALEVAEKHALDEDKKTEAARKSCILHLVFKDYDRFREVGERYGLVSVGAELDLKVLLNSLGANAFNDAYAICMERHLFMNAVDIADLGALGSKKVGEAARQAIGQLTYTSPPNELEIIDHLIGCVGKEEIKRDVLRLADHNLESNNYGLSLELVERLDGSVLTSFARKAYTHAKRHRHSSVAEEIKRKYGVY